MDSNPTTRLQGSRILREDATLRAENLLLVIAILILGTILFKNIGHPLLWQDEAETAVFATRVLEYGYPRVHGPRNVVYEFGPNIALGVKESIDAYIGTTWGHFYFAVPGVLWAAGVDDLYAKTARLRLPFAVAGALALGIFALIAMPAFRDAPRSFVLFTALFVLLSATSVSLILHLRELRYYPLVVLEVGAILRLYTRRALFGLGRGDARGVVLYGLGGGALLALLFHTFYAAYFVVVALVSGDALFRAWRVGEGPERRRLLIAGVLPAVVSGVVVAPSAVFFETVGIASGFAEHLGTTFDVYLGNLAGVTSHFLRQELLVAALATRFAVLATRAASARRGDPSDSGTGSTRRNRALQSLSDFLSFFAVGYVAITSLNPLVYERYFVVLSPVLTLVFLLDVFALSGELPRLCSEGNRRLARHVVTVAALMLVTLAIVLRAPELRGRLYEIAVPYRGPIDFAIEHLRSTHPDPAKLVIATNYAAHTYMYYLGSHVIVGLSLNNIRRERSLEPDVVIPRRRWPPGQEELRRFLSRGDFREFRLPVEDRHFNNIPAVTRTKAIPDPHRFRTPVTSDPKEQLKIYERIGSGAAPRGRSRS